MSFDISQQAGFEFRPETLLLEIERRLQEQRIILDRVLQQPFIPRNQAKNIDIIDRTETNIENLLKQKQLFEEEAVTRGPFISEPQITPQNNTLRNALIIGGVLLLIL